MGRYEADVDVDNPNLSHTQVVDLVGSGRTVLDVGCAEGDVARLLKARGCTVSGLDFDGEAAEKARADLDRLVIADLDRTRLSDHFEREQFDVIVFADVLEHLMDPTAALVDAAALLRPGGSVVVSVPNITHGSVRLALLQGRWRYTETGLLDRTHIRFFNRDGFVSLFADAGYRVEELRATVADPLRVEVEADDDWLPSRFVEWVRDQPDAFTYQFVASARPGSPERAPDLVPAVDPQGLRLDDRHAHRVRADERESRQQQHALLTLRDNAIGLEAAASSARRRQELAERRANRAEARVKRLQSKLARTQRRVKRAERQAVTARRAQRRVRAQCDAELRALRESRTWRAGRLVLSPLTALRRGR